MLTYLRLVSSPVASAMAFEAERFIEPDVGPVPDPDIQLKRRNPRLSPAAKNCRINLAP
jgi:hypothetical protein